MIKILSVYEWTVFDAKTEPWYHLSFIQKWDKPQDIVCSECIDNKTIYYKMYKCTPVTDTYYRAELVHTLTPEIEDVLKKKYILNTKDII